MFINFRNICLSQTLPYFDLLLLFETYSEALSSLLLLLLLFRWRSLSLLRLLRLLRLLSDVCTKITNVMSLTSQTIQVSPLCESWFIRAVRVHIRLITRL